METAQETFSRGTPGERACAVYFDPNGNRDVNRLKRAFAAIFDEVNEVTPTLPDGSILTGEKRRVCDEALRQIVSAEMWTVKALTFGR